MASMTHNDSSASNPDNKEHPGLWALLSLFGFLSIAGKAVGAWTTGALKIPFASSLLRAEHPMAFHCAIFALGIFAALSLVGAYVYAKEWQARR
jgi:hypothetical protein